MSKNPPINPWLNIWIKPRETIKELIAYNPAYLRIRLLIVVAFFDVVYSLVHLGLDFKEYLDTYFLFWGAIALIIYLLRYYFIDVFFLYYSYKFLGGRGSFDHTRTVNIWVGLFGIPVIIFLISRYSLYYLVSVFYRLAITKFLIILELIVILIGIRACVLGMMEINKISLKKAIIAIIIFLVSYQIVIIIIKKIIVQFLHPLRPLIDFI